MKVKEHIQDISNRFFIKTKKIDETTFAKLLASIFFLIGSIVAYYNTTVDNRRTDTFPPKTKVLIKVSKSLKDGEYFIGKKSKTGRVECLKDSKLLRVITLNETPFLAIERREDIKLYRALVIEKDTMYIKKRHDIQVRECADFGVIYSSH